MSKRNPVRLVVVAAATAVVAWQAYAFALVPNLRLSDPALALSRDPYDAATLSKQITIKSQKARAYVTSSEDSRDAAKSLIKAPLSRASLRIIGMEAAARKDIASAEEAIQLSNRISRRDSWAQIWLVEQAARNNDFDAILSHLNAALLVTPELSPVLNPILVQATVYPEVRDAVRPFLRGNAAWTPTFLNDAAKSAKLTDIYDIVEPVTRSLAADEYGPALAHLIFRLASEGRWDDAMRIAEASWKDFNPSEFGKAPPSDATSDKRLGRLAWTYAESNGISSSVGAGGSLLADLAPLSRGTIAERAFPVRAASGYTLTHRIRFERSARASRLEWSARCLTSVTEDGSVFWQETLPDGSGIHSFRATFAVPATCNLVALSLAGSGPDGQSSTAFEVTDLMLEQDI